MNVQKIPGQLYLRHNLQLEGREKTSVKHHRKRERDSGQRSSQIQKKLCESGYPAGDQKARALREAVSPPQKEIRSSEKAQI